MKSTRISSILGSSLIACVLTIGSLASIQTASAQSSTTLAKVDIPFAFQTANESFPAGMYVIDRKADHLILLRGPSGTAGFALTHDASRPHPADYGTVVFDRYGDKYFLRQIWRAGETGGIECPTSRAEKAAVVAQNKQAATTVALAFNAAPLK